MGLHISDQQHRFLTELLLFLRNEIKSSLPVSYAEFEGVAVKGDGGAIALANGICNVGDRFFHFTGDNPPHTVILFGPDDSTDGSAAKRFYEIAPRFLEAVKMFLSPEAINELKPDPSEDWKRALLAAHYVRNAVERTREFEPESLILPNVIHGKLRSDESPGSISPIVFPNGALSQMDTHHFSDWIEIRNLAGKGQISMYFLATPIVQSAALIVKYVLDGVEETRQERKAPKQKQVKLFDSGHNETEGEWCDPMPLSWIARAIKQSEEMTKRILAKNGLKQKSRENWIARTDTIKTDWSDAIIDAPKKPPK